MESDKEALIQSIQQRTRQMAMLPMQMPDITKLDLTMAQLRLVMLLYQKKQMHVSEVAAMFGVTSATVSGLIERMVERGVVLRQTDPEDRRAVICSLSPHGLEMMDGFSNTQQQMMDSLLQELSVKHLRAYDELLVAFMEIMMRKSQAPDTAGTA